MGRIHTRHDVERRRGAEEAAEDREHAEHAERRQDPLARLVHVALHLGVDAALAEEGAEVQPEHVEGGEPGRHERDRVERAVTRHVVRQVRGEQDLVLREEAREEREARDREHAEQEPAVRPRDLLPQPAHLVRVLLVVHGQDHGARAEEEQRLEEGVRDHVEDRGGVRTAAGREEHVAELAHGRVREHLLDVGLRERDGGREDRRRRARPRDHRGRARRLRVEEAEPADHVDAGRHHGGGVDQRRDRRRAGHGVGQPDVERDLRRLAHGTEEEAEPDQRGELPGRRPRQEAEPARQRHGLLRDARAAPRPARGSSRSRRPSRRATRTRGRCRAGSRSRRCGSR